MNIPPEMILAAISTLAGVIGYGFKRVMKKLDECESDRKDLWIQLLRIANHTGTTITQPPVHPKK